MADSRYTAYKKRDQVPTCPVMMACDGTTLWNGSRIRGMCVACEKKTKARAKGAKPLKGERYEGR